MAFACESCGKSTVTGRTHSHHRGVAGKRWKKRAPKTSRTFKPNLQNFKGMRLCATCIKKFKKDGRIQGKQPQTASI